MKIYHFSLEVDCRQIFKPGQLGVALGRAQTTKGLRVINFNAKRHVISQPANVMNFLNNTTSELQDDRSCCKPNHERYVNVTLTKVDCSSMWVCQVVLFLAVHHSQQEVQRCFALPVKSAELQVWSK